MISREWSSQQIFFAGAIPAVLAAGAIALSCLLKGRRSPYPSKITADPEVA
jgi:TRAP-type C4-dicarboxylate transport system permease large subunit